MSLTLLGAWLGAVGASDLLRGAGEDLGRAVVVRCAALGWFLLGIGLLILRPGVGWFALEVVLLGLCLTGWVWASVVASGAREETVRRRGRTAAFLALGAGLAVASVGAQTIDRRLAWPGWLDATAFSRLPAPAALVTVGVLAFEMASANLVVRLLLDAVGVPAGTNEKKLRGGRVLGPMERVFIVTLGALGQLTAVAIVVAAKGLLRFPELQRAHRSEGAGGDAGPSDVTEYFLIGSFASWLVALAGAGLIFVAVHHAS